MGHAATRRIQQTFVRAKLVQPVPPPHSHKHTLHSLKTGLTAAQETAVEFCSINRERVSAVDILSWDEGSLATPACLPYAEGSRLLPVPLVPHSRNA